MAWLEARAEAEPAQEGGVARLEAEPGGVAGHVGAVLVDHADHAQRHPHPRNPQAVRPHPAVDDLAHRVGQRGHPPQAGGHRRRSARRSVAGDPGRTPPCRRTRRGRGHPGWPPATRRRLLLEQVGRHAQGVVAHRSRGAGHRAASAAADAARQLRRGPVWSPDQRTSTRSSRCTTRWDMSSGSWSLRRPTHSEARAARRRTRPLAKILPSGPTISTASSGPKSPSDGHHAGREQRPPAFGQGLVGPLVDDEAARGSQGEGDPQLAGREAVGPGPEHGAHAGLAGHCRRHDAGPGGVGDDRLHPRPGGDFGGSDRGPVMAYEALRYYSQRDLTFRFVSNIDGTDFVEATRDLNAEETLFIISSKTFTTLETMTNAHTAREWALKTLKNPAAIAKHFVAVSTNTKEVQNSASILPICLNFGIGWRPVLNGFFNWTIHNDRHWPQKLL